MGLGGIVGWGGSNNNNLAFAPQQDNRDQTWSNFDPSNQVNTPTAYTPSGDDEWKHDEYGAAMAKQAQPSPTAQSFSPTGQSQSGLSQFAQNPKGYLIGQGMKGLGVDPSSTTGQFLSNPRGYLIGQALKGAQSVFGSSGTKAGGPVDSVLSPGSSSESESNSDAASSDSGDQSIVGKALSAIFL